MSGRDAEEVKPCPFCGSVEIAGPGHYDTHDQLFAFIECEECGARFEFSCGNEEAGARLCMEAWNRRAP